VNAYGFSLDLHAWARVGAEHRLTEIHQVLQAGGGSPIVYAGSTERTSFAEALETKGFVVLELARSGLRHSNFDRSQRGR
jgi:DNA repair exonuclease SbcCD nuclease subunit